MEKKISIVIPVYNAGGALAECLDSVFAGGYKNFEVLLVDDCSTDGSVEIARRYPCKAIVLSERRGPAFARDKGASLAGGDIVAFLDSDCIVPRDWLNKINKRLTPDMAGIGGRYDLPKDINIISKLFMAYWYLKDLIYEKPRGLISLYGGNSAFWRTALMQKRKKSELLYCNRIIGSDDTLACSELTRFGRVIYDPDISVIHNQRCTLLNILKKSFSYGYGGAKTVRQCGRLLFREPHHLYKSLLYILSASLLLLTFMLPFLPVWKVYLSILLFYIAAQLPIIFLAGRRLLKTPYLILLPAVIFTVNIFNLAGHLKRGLEIIRSAVKSGLWYIKFITNILNPLALSRLFFFVTKKCNANCYFCFNKKGGHISGGGKDLSLKEIEKITNNIGFLPWLTITGGEPFLREGLYKICRLFYRNCDTGFIDIVTNGIASPRIEETAERLLLDCEQLHLTITIALDDIEKRHDYLKGVEGCYQDALSALEGLNALKLRFPGLRLAINTILVEENTGQIEDILHYFSNNLKYDRHYLNLLRQPASASIKPEFISVEKYFKLLQTTNGRLMGQSSLIKQRFNQALLEYCCLKSLKEFKLKKSLGACLAGQKFLVLNNNGDIFACELLIEKLGSLRDEGYGFAKIRKSRKAKEAGQKIRRTRCYCQWPCAVSSNTLFKISSYPKILSRMGRAYLKGRSLL